MFASLNRVARSVSIFHNPASLSSLKTLELLQEAVSGPYPPDTASNPPLYFNLDVVEGPPNRDQLETISSYVKTSGQQPASSIFLSAHPSSPYDGDQPLTFGGVAQAASHNPNALKWPIVVDWFGGKASVGDIEGVKKILEDLRKERDEVRPVEKGETSRKSWFKMW
ncbi:uncharacterized protein BT62DRAFT_1010844 [Guyanagaster necrorhizus]|uniref:Thioredoxin-like protein n=1 Tax=Guyanagaster necrorhizus TaxID=856835 RepID=A0A9P7VK53_9AGAR|nr:uncharacterized protein BT62DRAFT_1010844 [Guyanagaster necrorhizus MCA 3950]KAG7442058.1 hypothetical protein BT62DRAFT_1010844 [Guyanagaster necrorhizus MCA 3950]